MNRKRIIIALSTLLIFTISFSSCRSQRGAIPCPKMSLEKAMEPLKKITNCITSQMFILLSHKTTGKNSIRFPDQNL